MDANWNNKIIERSAITAAPSFRNSRGVKRANIPMLDARWMLLMAARDAARRKQSNSIACNLRGVGMMVAQLAKLSNPSSSDPVFSAGNDNFDFQIHGYGRRDGNTFVAIRS